MKERRYWIEDNIINLMWNQTLDKNSKSCLPVLSFTALILSYTVIVVFSAFFASSQKSVDTAHKIKGSSIIYAHPRTLENLDHNQNDYVDLSDVLKYIEKVEKKKMADETDAERNE